MQIREAPVPRIGLYSAGLQAYWNQFPGLKDRLLFYANFIKERLLDYAEVFYFGLVDEESAGHEAGEYFNSNNVDLIFCHNATYVNSTCILPVHRICKAPAVVLNLQPAPRVAYLKITTGEWLSQCTGCSVPEISNAFNRAGIPFRVVNGLLGLSENSPGAISEEICDKRPEAIRAWNEIISWTMAAGVKRALLGANFGFLGNYYSGMLDMYSDFTMLQSQLGINIKLLEMCDVKTAFDHVDDATESQIKDQVLEMFEISRDSFSEPLAKKPTDEQLSWACRVAAAQESLVRTFHLDALTYYYHGCPDGEYEKLQAGFIVGNSLLTAKGIACAGEADIKTCVAMKICDILGIGGSFSEIVVTDYVDGTILLGHDGPFHIAIAKGKPILRGMGLYHGKQGTGVSVEAKVMTGPITMLGLTQTIDGKLKFIISEGEATDGAIMQIGNTQTPVKFGLEPDEYMDKWFAQAPTHHAAMSVGHNAKQLEKVAQLLDVAYVVI